ncbi:HEAT repeat domain-containing protein, partial [Methanoculleus bourgensis]|uniref:HEAT repeat domain-containing protein n=1 Tax=Methanoculleus bourgensis TaxID=83986 RepID=UPI003B9550BD
MPATPAPETLCPIVGLAGLFGPDGTSFIRHRMRRGSREGDNEEGTRDPDQETSRRSAEEEPGEPSSGGHAWGERDTDVLERIEKTPGALRRFDDLISPEGESADLPVASASSEETTPGHSLPDDPDDGVPEEPDEPPGPPMDDRPEPLTDEELMILFGPGDGDEEPSPGIIGKDAGLPEDEPDPGEPVEDPPYEDRPMEVLIDDLGSDDTEVRERAVDAIAKRGSGAVAPLIEALSLADDRRRWCVAEALAALGDEAIPALIAALGDEAAQAGAAATLVRIGGPAVPPLIAVLAGGDGEVQFGARYALQEIGDEAVPSLVEALDAPDGTIRRAAAGVLGNLGWRPPDDGGTIRYLIAGEAWLDVAEYGAAAIDPLIRILRSPDRETWWSAARTLGEIGEPAVTPLIDLLHEADGEVSSLAVMALAEIGGPAV